MEKKYFYIVVDMSHNNSTDTVIRGIYDNYESAKEKLIVEASKDIEERAEYLTNYYHHSTKEQLVEWLEHDCLYYEYNGISFRYCDIIKGLVKSESMLTGIVDGENYDIDLQIIKKEFSK